MIGGFKDLCYNTTKLKPLISECFADKLGLAFQILCIRDSIDVKIEEPHNSLVSLDSLWLLYPLSMSLPVSTLRLAPAPSCPGPRYLVAR